MMSAHQKRVYDLMAKIGQKLPDKPTTPSEKVCVLRAKLILEEAFETIKGLGISVHGSDENLGSFVITGQRGPSIEFEFEASHAPNIVEVVDGCCDMNVISAGTLLAFGVQDEEPQRLVDESNLEKFEVPTCIHCNLPMILHKGTEVWFCDAPNCSYTLPKEKGPYLREDGKWIKPPYWAVPDIEGEIKRQANLTKNVEFAEKYSTSDSINGTFSLVDPTVKVEPLSIFKQTPPRDPSEVLDRILAAIPVTALVTRNRFKAVYMSSCYCAPEDIGRIWQEGQSLINELAIELERTEWGKKVLRIWSNNA